MGSHLGTYMKTFALCTPVQYNWDKSIPGSCTDQSRAYLGASITNLIIDAFIVIFPMSMLFRLQISWLKKLSIAVMFSLGVIICVFSLLRIFSILSWDLTVVPISDNTYDG
ncbi:hypothetical protein F4813DRAFT_351403, partial [Daldinia decipiens]|uniref:uncharacterized protein n=1 Tax=Daldinia decipiens TaxID=326647 RepID=UPI0020C24027